MTQHICQHCGQPLAPPFAGRYATRVDGSMWHWSCDAAQRCEQNNVAVAAALRLHPATANLLEDYGDISDQPLQRDAIQEYHHRENRPAIKRGQQKRLF